MAGISELIDCLDELQDDVGREILFYETLGNADRAWAASLVRNVLGRIRETLLAIEHTHNGMTSRCR